MGYSYGGCWLTSTDTVHACRYAYTAILTYACTVVIKDTQQQFFVSYVHG